jgi:hypothetical protein
MSLRNAPEMTDAKLAAQRSNAQHSTGPRSAAGKSKSRINALKHGGYATAAAWSDEALRALGENPGELLEMVVRLKAADGPADDPLWELAAEELARQIWRRRRLERAWEALALRHGASGEPIHLVTLTEEGRELMRQLEAADRAVGHKTRLLLRLREAEERHRRQLEASARRRIHQMIEQPTESPDTPTEEELAHNHARLVHREQQTARLERQAAALAAEVQAALQTHKNAERSQNVLEKKEPEVRSQETEARSQKQEDEALEVAGGKGGRMAGPECEI